MKIKTPFKGGLARIAAAAVCIILLYTLPFASFISQNTLRVMLSIALYCTLGQMWNLMSGYTGMTSLGHQIFIGLAGYSVAVFTSAYGLPYWMGMLFGGVASAVMAAFLSALLFRMNGMYFAIATWVTAEIMKIVFSSWSFVKLGAGMGIKIKPYPTTAEIYLMAVTLAAAAIIAVYFILKSRVGLGLTAMRDDTTAASGVGVNIFRMKMLCYMVSAFITGLVGSLFYINQGSIFPNKGFGSEWTVAAVFIVIIGGVGTVSGSIAGAVAYVLLIELLSKTPGFSMIILGVTAIFVILVMPNGILGTLERKIGFELLPTRRK